MTSKKNKKENREDNPFHKKTHSDGDGDRRGCNIRNERLGRLFM